MSIRNSCDKAISFVLGEEPLAELILRQAQDDGSF
jgi:hypothetical protein